MAGFQTILCPTDFSEFSGLALRYAASLAAREKARLVLLHVMEDLYLYTRTPEGQRPVPIRVDEVFTEIERQLGQMFRPEFRSQLDLETLVTAGRAYDSILESAGKHAVDLIVMGTHGRRGWERLVLGSTTEKVLRKSNWPVLTLCRPVTEEMELQGEEMRLSKIVYATDFSEGAGGAWQVARNLAERYGAEILLVHIVPGILPEAILVTLRHAVPQYGHVLQEDAQKRLGQFVEKEGLAARATILTAVGEPWKEIIRVARESKANLIVLGAHGWEGWEMALLGSTVSRVIRDAPCPVVTVRHAP
jgi:nucleotide-binding universal stress UspA family protein